MDQCYCVLANQQSDCHIWATDENATISRATDRNATTFWTTNEQVNKIDILQWNINGANTKIISLESFLHKQNITIAVVQETKFSKQLEFMYYINGYNCIILDGIN